MANKESMSGVLYKGFDYANYHDNTSKRVSTDINEVQLNKTDRFTYQCATDRDYENHLIKDATRYELPKVTLLVVNSRKI